MNIRKRFIIFSIILGIVPVVISTSICIANFNDKSRELIKQNVITSARDQSMNLESFFNQNVSDLNITVSIPAVKDLLTDSNNKINIENEKNNREILNEVFSNTTNQQSYLSTELLINKDGIIISSSNNEYINTKVILSSEDLERLAHNEVVVTDVIEREDFNNGIKSAIIAKPIFFRDIYQGAMINVIKMEYFKNIIGNIHFFECGKVAIMDSKQKVVASNSENLGESISISNDLSQQWG